MSDIFVCYSRENEEPVKRLAADLDALGHESWFDQELIGGQIWWEQILKRIRESDIIVIALSVEALQSEACKREYGYSADVGRPILPVIVAEGVSTRSLPRTLSEIQILDYQKRTPDSALKLARAIAAVPEAGPLPEPLPEPPEVPLSYLADLQERVRTTKTLDLAEQSELLVEVMRISRASETSEDGRTLLETFSKRRDLLAVIADDARKALADTPRKPRRSRVEAFAQRRPWPKLARWAVPALRRMALVLAVVLPLVGLYFIVRSDLLTGSELFAIAMSGLISAAAGLLASKTLLKESPPHFSEVLFGEFGTDEDIELDGPWGITCLVPISGAGPGVLFAIVVLMDSSAGCGFAAFTLLLAPVLMFAALLVPWFLFGLALWVMNLKPSVVMTKAQVSVWSGVLGSLYWAAALTWLPARLTASGGP